MTFVCTVEAEFVPPLVQRNGSSHLVLMPVGYQLYENKSYFMMVTLDVLPGGLYEFAFCLVEYDEETDSEYEYWNSDDVRRLIPKEDRRILLAVLLAITKYLIESVKPDDVSMCTSDGGLPDKALIKFTMLCDVFDTCGYDVSVYDEYHGQHVWRMARRV